MKASGILTGAMAFAAAAILSGTTGCQSPKGSSGSPVSVLIWNQPAEAIAGATKAVFLEEGYTGGIGGPDRLFFERPGSTFDNLAYANFVEGKVTVQLVVTLQDRGNGSTLLGCSPAIVESAGNPVMEDKHSVHKVRLGPYQKLLDKVKARLQKTPAQ